MASKSLKHGPVTPVAIAGDCTDVWRLNYDVTALSEAESLKLDATIRAGLLAKRFMGAKLTPKEEVCLAATTARLEIATPRMSSESEEALSVLEREIADMRDRRLASEAESRPMPPRKQALTRNNNLTRAELRQVAEDDARRLLGVSAEEAWRLIDAHDPKVAGTIVEVELKNLRWLLAD